MVVQKGISTTKERREQRRLGRSQRPTDSEKLYKQAEKATEDRDLALGQGGVLRDKTVRYYVHSVRDLLQGLNKGNETALGTWGFDVLTSPKSGGSAAARKAAKNTPPAV